MTIRPGTYEVLDPAVRASIEDLLATAGRLLATAVSVDQVSDSAPGCSVESLHERCDTAEQECRALRGRVAELEGVVSHRAARIKELGSALETARAAAQDLPSPPGVVDARGKDRAAFELLAARMEAQAVSKPKAVAETLRVAAKGLYTEIEAVYGMKKVRS